MGKRKLQRLNCAEQYLFKSIKKKTADEFGRKAHQKHYFHFNNNMHESQVTMNSWSEKGKYGCCKLAGSGTNIIQKV